MHNSPATLSRATAALTLAFNKAAFLSIDRQTRYTNMFLLVGSGVGMLFMPSMSYLMLDTLLTMNVVLGGYKFAMTKFRPVSDMPLTRALSEAREAVREESALDEDYREALADHLSEATGQASQAINHLRAVERDHAITNAITYGAMMIGSSLSSGGAGFFFASMAVLGLSAYYNHHATAERLSVSDYVLRPLEKATLEAYLKHQNAPRI